MKRDNCESTRREEEENNFYVGARLTLFGRNVSARDMRERRNSRRNIDNFASLTLRSCFGAYWKLVIIISGFALCWKY